MVVFTCQHCGDSVKKPKVEKHYDTKCRFKTPDLTCIDCLKDFKGNMFAEHNQCLTEEEKYSAKGTVFKEHTGKKKQAKYTELIQNLLDTSDLSVVQRKLLIAFSNFDNVPKKWPKFQNFSQSVVRNVKHNNNELKSVFDIIEEAWKKQNGSGESLVKEIKSANADERGDANKSIDSVGEDESKNTVVDNNEANADKDGPEDCKEVTNTKETISNGLSKKKLKKQKKYEKYLIELENEAKSGTDKKNVMSKESNKVDESMEVEDNHNDGHKINKKKSKRSKSEQVNSEPGVVNGNENVEPTIAEDATVETKKKKNKKRKHENSICDVAEKKTKEAPSKEEEVGEAQKVFDWGGVIIRVLESRPDKELSLKRLAKKVIDEYQTVKLDHRTYEDLLAKFNKKIKKTKGLRVLKDKAKLIDQ